MKVIVGVPGLYLAIDVPQSQAGVAGATSVFCAGGISPHFHSCQYLVLLLLVSVTHQPPRPQLLTKEYMSSWL